LHDEELLTQGPYNCTRNPLYFGSWLAFSSFGFLFNAWVLMVMSLMLLYSRLRLIYLEEKLMQARWKDKFDTFVLSVPRLIPSFRRIPFVFTKCLFLLCSGLKLFLRTFGGVGL
jgi:protein-S-isoprenylcysteine O-methyltransferase Ste14